MQSVLSLVSVAMLLATTPVVSSAQTAPPITHAQVRQQLLDLEERGYWPSNAKDIHYPDDLQAAEAQLNAARTMPPSGHLPNQGAGAESHQ